MENEIIKEPVKAPVFPPLDIRISDKIKVQMDDAKWDDAMEWILTLSRKDEPTVQTILMCSVDYAPVKKTPEGFGPALAYTYYDRLRMQIAIDFTRVGATTEDPKYSLFLIYHEFMHNLLQHFTRRSITEYQKRDANLTNVLIDYYCNIAALDMAKTDKDTINKYMRSYYTKEGLKAQEEIDNIGIVHEKEIAELAEKFGLEYPFEQPLDEMIEEELLEIFFNSPKMKDYENGQKALKDAVEKLMKGAPGSHEEMEKSIEAAAKELGMDPGGLKDLIQSKLNAEFEDAEKTAGQGGSAVGRHRARNKKKIDILNTFKIKNVIGKKLVRHTKRTYSRPYRKSDEDVNVIRKGKQKLKGNKLVVAIDVSGSVSESDLQKCFAICNGYLAKNQGELEVVFWSSCEIVPKRDVIESVTRYEDLEKHPVYSSGGTVVEHLHNYLEKKYTKEKISFVNISDFYFCTYPPLPECIKEAYHLAVCKEAEDISRKRYPNAHTVLVKE